MCKADTEDAISENFISKIKKLKTFLNILSQRNLSLKGKVAVLRSIALPQLLYVSTVLFTPDWVIKRVDKLLIDFLWSNKKHHIKKEVICQDIEYGGLKAPHFDSMIKAVKCTWIKRIMAENINSKELLKCFLQYKDFHVQSIIKFNLDALCPSMNKCIVTGMKYTV